MWYQGNGKKVVSEHDGMSVTPGHHNNESEAAGVMKMKVGQLAGRHDNLSEVLPWALRHPAAPCRPNGPSCRGGCWGRGPWPMQQAQCAQGW